MYAIFHVKYIDRPYIFQDEDTPKQIPAVYKNKAEAEEICARMNSDTTAIEFIVKVWCP